MSWMKTTQKLLGAVKTAVLMYIRFVLISLTELVMVIEMGLLEADFEGLDLDVIVCQIEISQNDNVGYSQLLRASFRSTLRCWL